MHFQASKIAQSYLKYPHFLFAAFFSLPKTKFETLRIQSWSSNDEMKANVFGVWTGHTTNAACVQWMYTPRTGDHLGSLCMMVLLLFGAGMVQWIPLGHVYHSVLGTPIVRQSDSCLDWTDQTRAAPSVGIGDLKTRFSRVPVKKADSHICC